MRSWRILGFVLAIALGLAAGLLAGWLLSPPAAQAAEPQSLRADYKGDFVLMTAEIYSQDGDLAVADARLRPLGAQDSLQAMQQAIITGQELGYEQADMQLLARLFTGLQRYTPVPPEPTP
ncbi:MAG TPA: hypothetical protein DCP32_10570 [Anaerolineaceae bacterium]|nr:MAG: hypothetical protein A2X24_13005 [Chloroflexi bacterium GWB2_54_36]HAL17163.1 hypothetical protein [Anaerolineaceae bacterium]